MNLKSLSTKMRYALAASARYWNGSLADLAMIDEILKQASALREFSRYFDAPVNRSSSVRTRVPSNRVWQLWFQGEACAPEIVKACLSSVRLHLGNREIILLNKDNIEDYISIPGHIYDRKEQGCISNGHFSDIIRTFLLAEYGGTWLDATVYLTAPPLPAFLRGQLFAFRMTSPALMGAGSVVASSWFLHSDGDNCLFATIRDLLTEYWHHESDCRHYYNFHLMFALAVRESKQCEQLWKAVPYYSNVPSHILQFELFHRFDAVRFDEIKQMTPVHKLTHYGDIEYTPQKLHTFYAHLTAGARACS
jgi:hypothetical protein